MQQSAGARMGDALRRGWTTCLDDRPASEGRCRYQTAEVLEKTRSIVAIGPSLQDSYVDLAKDVAQEVVLSPLACVRRMHRTRRPSQKQLRIIFRFSAKLARESRVSARLVSRLRVCFNRPNGSPSQRLHLSWLSNACSGLLPRSSGYLLP